MNDKYATLDTTMRSNGLPYLVPRTRWHHRLFSRTAPALMYVSVAVSLLTGVLLFWLYSGVYFMDNEDLHSLTNIVSIVLIPISLIVAVGIARLLTAALRNASVIIRWIVPIGLFFIMALLFDYFYSSISGMGGEKYDFDGIRTLTDSSVVTLVTGGVLLFVTYLGLGSISTWIMKSLYSQLFAIQKVASRVLPVIFMVVVFSFYAAEIWQIVDKVDLRRIIIFAVCTLLFIALTSIGVAKNELNPKHTGTKNPFSHLSRLKQFNIYFVIAGTMFLQGLIFFVVFALMIFTLGLITLTDPVLNAWLTHDPTPVTVMGKKLFFSTQLIGASVFISIFATISFMVAASTDTEYRDVLFDPIIKRIRMIIAGNHSSLDR